MKLKTKIKTLNPKELIYIGSKSSYFFIGYPDDFETEIVELNVKHLNTFLTTLKNTENRYSTLLQNKPDKNQHATIKVWENGKSIDKEVDYDYLIKKWYDNIRQLKETIAKYKKLVTTFKDFRERDVLECYRNIDNTGTIIIVSGQECGRFWTYDEVLKVKNGGKIIIDDEYDEGGEDDYE